MKKVLSQYRSQSPDWQLRFQEELEIVTEADILYEAARQGNFVEMSLLRHGWRLIYTTSRAFSIKTRFGPAGIEDPSRASELVRARERETLSFVPASFQYFSYIFIRLPPPVPARG